MPPIDFSTLLTLVAVSGLTATLAISSLVLLTARPKRSIRIPVQDQRVLPAPIGLDAVTGEDMASLVALHDTTDPHEVAFLREAVARAPILLWRRDKSGQILWANDRYMDLLHRLYPQSSRAWPPPDLFADFLPVGLPNTNARRRASFEDRGKRLWFEVSALDGERDTLLCSATSIDRIVEAEEARRLLLQTLTQTFAQLRTGLAIFNSDRRLVTFNPALVELTGLSAEWLACRPQIASVFDNLRSHDKLPEPKDYKSWRDRLASIEAAAHLDGFDEIWTLPDAQVLRVSARPFPDGGLAFLIDDISEEMTLTRRFRSELDLGQAVIDALEDGIVVFSPVGTQLMANKAYANLWKLRGEGGDDTLDAPTIYEAFRHWQDATHPAPLWGEIREFVTSVGPRAEWTDETRLNDSSVLACRVIPLAGGSTLVGFSRSDPIPVFRPARAAAMIEH